MTFDFSRRKLLQLGAAGAAAAMSRDSQAAVPHTPSLGSQLTLGALGPKPNFVPDSDAADSVVLLYCPGGVDPCTTFHGLPNANFDFRNPAPSAYTTLSNGLIVNNLALGSLTPLATELTVIRSGKTEANPIGNHNEVTLFSFFRQLLPKNIIGNPNAQNVINHFASAFTMDAPDRAALNLVDYRPVDSDWNFIAMNNSSPNPAAAAQYLPKPSAWGSARFADFVSALSPGATGNQELMNKVNARLKDRVDQYFARGTQRHLADAMRTATVGSVGTSSLDPKTLWPPSSQVLNTLRQNLAPSNTYERDFQESVANSLAFAFNGLKAGHLPFYTIMAPFSWIFDCHNAQTIVGDSPYESTQKFFGAICNPLAGFIQLLKATSSPRKPGKTLDQTTVVVLMTEMGHLAKSGSSDSGFSHGPVKCTALFGGPLKRGKVVGTCANMVANPVDFTTGTDGGTLIPNDAHTWNTVAAACNVPLPYPNDPFIAGAIG